MHEIICKMLVKCSSLKIDNVCLFNGYKVCFISDKISWSFSNPLSSLFDDLSFNQHLIWTQSTRQISFIIYDFIQSAQWRFHFPKHKLIKYNLCNIKTISIKMYWPTSAFTGNSLYLWLPTFLYLRPYFPHWFQSPYPS